MNKITLVDRIMKFYFSFAKYGSHTPDWWRRFDRFMDE